MISKKNLKALLIIFGIIFVVSTVFCNDFSTNKDIISSDDENSDDTNETNLKAATSWVLTTTEIVIDDSGGLGPTYIWDWYKNNRPWCSGSGIWGDPYVIENVTFDIAGEDYGISIKNSKVPFIINNCTFKNSIEVGMELDNVNNSLIKDNFIMDNGHSGIMAVDSNNNTVSGNYLRNNGLGPYGGTAGIGFYVDKDRVGGIFYCSYNNISGNTVYDNSRGIGLFASGYGGATIYCHNNSISGNNITENNDVGIEILIFGGENDGENDRVYSSNNSITNNNITLNKRYGIGYKIIGENNSIVYSNFTTISGNIITDNEDDGLFLTPIGEDTAKVRVNNFTLSGNNIAFNWEKGINFDVEDHADVEAKYNNITGNTIIQNGEEGIYLAGCTYMTLVENEMHGNGIVIDPAAGLGDISSHYIDKTNTANNKPVYYYTNEKNLGAANFTGAGQVILINCDDSLISGLDVSNASMGIAHYFGENVTIYNNNVSYGLWGIILYGSNENNITKNKANYNDWNGIFLIISNDNNITQNTANNNDIGISLWGSNYTLVSGNTLLGNRICIEQVQCEMNTFINNNCGIAPSDGNGNGKKKKKEEVIPGYDLFILISTIFILIGAIYIISIKKRL